LLAENGLLDAHDIRAPPDDFFEVRYCLLSIFADIRLDDLQSSRKLACEERPVSENFGGPV
jgi:hypothetical protein